MSDERKPTDLPERPAMTDAERLAYSSSLKIPVRESNGTWQQTCVRRFHGNGKYTDYKNG